MSIEERNRIVALERRVEALESVVNRLLEEQQKRAVPPDPRTLKLPEKKSA